MSLRVQKPGMRASKQMKRTELLHAKKTGLDRDVSWWVQKNLFDKGHEAEALARPILEGRIGEDLFPVVGTEGDLLASLDGCTILGDVLFEHKMWNERLAADVRAGTLDPHYYWQLEQQLLVSGAEKVIFVCSDGTEEKFVSMEYTPAPQRSSQVGNSSKLTCWTSLRPRWCRKPSAKRRSHCQRCASK